MTLSLTVVRASALVFWALVAAGAASACGSSSRQAARAELPGGAGGSAGNSGAGGEAGASTDPVDLDLDVVEYEVRGGPADPVPAVGASVRIEGRRVVVEVTTDQVGHVHATLARPSGPWNVTVARPGFTAVSILGVKGAIEGPLTISTLQEANVPAAEAPVRLSGRLFGLLDACSALDIESPTDLNIQMLYDDQYVALVGRQPGADSVPILATERVDDTYGAEIRNAVWVETPWTGEDIALDITFPSTPRAPARTELVLDTPTTGAVTGDGLIVTGQSVYRSEHGHSFNVGHAAAEPDPGTPGRFKWIIGAFDGDMAPSQLWTTLGDATGEHSIIIGAAADGAGNVSVPPAEALDATGTSVDTYSLTWSASAYDAIGASLHRADGARGDWYVYGYDQRELRGEPWPHLPTNVSLGDIALDTTELHLDVFSHSDADGVPLWTWRSRGAHDEVSLVRSFGPPPATSNPSDASLGANQPTSCGPPIVPGIYAVTDSVLNETGCAPGGAPEPSHLRQRFFFLTSHVVASCGSVEECRSFAADSSRIASEWQCFLGSPRDETPPAEFFLPTPDASGQCRDAWLQRARASVDEPASIRIEVEITNLPPFTADSVQGCTWELAQAAATGLSCNELRVVTGSFVEPL